MEILMTGGLAVFVLWIAAVTMMGIVYHATWPSSHLR
jgi:hypothetical protein